MAKGPMLSAEWLRQPEVVELVQHMATFTAALMGHLLGSDPTANMDGGVGRLDKNAPAQGMPDQGPDGNVPWGRLGPDGLPMTELQQYQADEQQAWNDSLMKSQDDPMNRTQWQDDNHVSQAFQQAELRVPAAEYNFNPATGKIQRDREGEPVVSYGGADALAPGAPRETGDSNSKTAVSYEQRNPQIRGARGAALME